MTAERGVRVEHSTIHHWVVRYTPQLLEAFNARKRPMISKWHVDETYIKVKGRMFELLGGAEPIGVVTGFDSGDLLRLGLLKSGGFQINSDSRI